MSKFIDKLKHISDGAPQPMGFRTRVAAPPKPKMQLAAEVSADNLADVADVASVVDAVLVTAPSETALDKVAKQAGEVPWGVWPKEATDLKEAVPARCDFIVVSPQSPVERNESGSQGSRILVVDQSFADGMLRAVNDVPVDAVLLVAGPASANPLTWERLLVIQRCANLMSKPLLTTVGANVTPGELQSLWMAGIDCVLIESGTLEQLRSVRQTIAAATFPLPRRRERAGALVPRINHEPHHPAEEEEEE